jgi:hypothetical protein
MRSFWAPRADPYSAGIHPALTSLADEVCGTLARLIAYVGTLALLAILGIHLWDQLPVAEDDTPVVEASWSPALRIAPAFAVSQSDFAEKTQTYEILRHPEGGRKDIFRWAASGEKPAAELEIYRPGGEFSRSGPVFTDLARRMDPQRRRELEAAGIIDSKFGPVTLSRLTGSAGDVKPCLGFVKDINDPHLQISGWSCQGEALPAQRTAIGCILSRLILLTAGNDPKLAELFARAELKRGSCVATAGSAMSADWVTNAENPLLRGAF